MATLLPKLGNSIEKKDFKQIALLAHSIKGSSGNFRIKVLQDTSSQMEQMAKREDLNYDYREAYLIILEKLETIRVE